MADITRNQKNGCHGPVVIMDLHQKLATPKFWSISDLNMLSDILDGSLYHYLKNDLAQQHEYP